MGKPEITVTRIGVIDVEGGRDEYVLVKRLDDDITEEQAEEYILKRVYRECHAPGGYFCTSVIATQQKYSGNECVVVILHRYDI